MPKRPIPKTSTKRASARPTTSKDDADQTGQRNGVSFVLNQAEHTRILAETIQISNASGIDVTIGKYAKHALMAHRRLRLIETRLRGWLSDFESLRDNPEGGSVLSKDVSDKIRSLLETPLAG